MACRRRSIELFTQRTFIMITPTEFMPLRFTADVKINFALLLKNG